MQTFANWVKGQIQIQLPLPNSFCQIYNESSNSFFVHSVTDSTQDSSSFNNTFYGDVGGVGVFLCVRFEPTKCRPLQASELKSDWTRPLNKYPKAV